MQHKCNLYEKCSAPFCPLDARINKRLWFSDEQICGARWTQALSWIQAQKKIKKRARDTSRYFTLTMLSQNCRLKKGITGLNPDMPVETERKRIEKWCLKHPPKKEVSHEEKQEFIERMKKAKRGDVNPTKNMHLGQKSAHTRRF
ncbi:hypothetical protein CEE35_03465 [Candidatus Aerophobetes bacterium Ae_b3b]|nr:MAG: hypothetical protein CEE35_03465 [Candidatus Aerophobetes bacterium Ae_b3b]